MCCQLTSSTMSIIDLATSINIEILCRLCGTETTSQDELIHIFDTKGLALNLKSKIKNCLGFEVSEYDYLPKILCVECVDNLGKFDEFKINSNKTKLQLLNLIKQKLINTTKGLVNIQETSSNSSKHIEVNKTNKESSTKQTSLLHNLLLSQLPSNVIRSQDNRQEIKSQCNICKKNECTCKSDSETNTNLDSDSVKREPLDYETSDNLENENNDALTNIFEPELHIETDESKMGNLLSKNKKSLPIESNPDACNNMEIIFQCEYCNEGFLSYDISIIHVKMVHLKYKNKTGYVQSKKDKFSYNMPKNNCKDDDEKEEETIVYKCDLCPRECITKRKLRLHMQKHAPPAYACTMCEMKFKYHGSLKDHIKRHNKDYDHICTYCGEGFIGKTCFDNHVKSEHTKEYPFSCTKCDKKFTNKGRLTAHEKIVHTDVYSYSCDICNRCFKSRFNLQSHKKIHDPLKTRQKFKCSLCDSAFVNKSSLTSHMSGHTGELKYKCEICNKRYKGNSGFKIHMLTHTGEKNCVCEICGKAFALNSNLITHRRTHTGERPFKCDVCQKTFTQKSSLNTHRKKSCSN